MTTAHLGTRVGAVRGLLTGQPRPLLPRLPARWPAQVTDLEALALALGGERPAQPAYLPLTLFCKVMQSMPPCKANKVPVLTHSTAIPIFCMPALKRLFSVSEADWLVMKYGRPCLSMLASKPGDPGQAL
jgi:hypothetical protein